MGNLLGGDRCKVAATRAPAALRAGVSGAPSGGQVAERKARRDLWSSRQSSCSCVSLVGMQQLGFMPSVEGRIRLDQLDLACLGTYFVLAAWAFVNSYRRASSGILRQQLKWVTGGALAGILPFLCFYVVPYFLGIVPRPWMNISAVSLALIPLCFGYAIIRYRLMDVDIIFKRGLAYTAASGGLVAVVHRPGRADRRAVPYYAALRNDGRRHCYFCCRIFVPAVSRLDSGAPGPLLLPGSSELSQNIDRIWPDPQFRSAARSDAGIGHGPHLAGAAGGPRSRFRCRRNSSRHVPHGALGRCALLGPARPEFPR